MGIRAAFGLRRSPIRSAGSAAPGRDKFSIEYGLIRRHRERHVTWVKEPLVLISQIQRSGGTLLSQLFDGHPECHAHPYELKIGFPRKEIWPALDLEDTPEAWFKILLERRFRRLFEEGYSKASSGAVARGATPEIFPLLLPPRLQQGLFVKLARKAQIESQRDVLDIYMTSFFNAWLDNQNLYAQPKKWITGFTPRTVMEPESTSRFFEDYPDGLMICMIRRAEPWYASARLHAPEEYGDLERAITLWRSSADAIEEARRLYGDRVIVVTYEELVSDTESVMRRLASRLDIEFHPSLLHPTFNGRPIRADSSFPVDSGGIISAGLGRGAKLPRGESKQIAASTNGTYERVARLSVEA